MGLKSSKENSGSASGEYPHASILKGAADSDAALDSINGVKSDGVSPMSQQHKLTIWTGMVFVVGEMAGSGVLALPQAIENSGWIGVLVLILSCISVGWCGILLGKCWLMLEERFPEYQDHCRDPYPSIGYEAFGKPGRILVSVFINVSLFGVSVVFMILAAENLHTVLKNVHALSFSPCLWMLILAALLTPFVWLGTPKDFWPIAVGATVATGIACVFLIASISTDPQAKIPSEVTHNPVNVKNFALAFGTILFSFGGAAAFPTIQQDMRVSTDFPKAIFLAFTVLMLMYVPVATIAYALLGDKLSDNILVTLSQDLQSGTSWLYYTIQVLIIIHLLFAFTIVINPICQTMEKLFKVPQHFTWKRALLRTICVLVELFVAESVPHFGPILSLIGGATTTFLAIVFPCVFYLKLCSLTSPGWPERRAALHEKVFSVEIVIVGIVGGVITTYSAIEVLTNPNTLIPPCYVNMTIG